MRITIQLLHKLTSGPLERVTYLDLSSRRIGLIEQLDSCQSLHTLLLQDNIIDTVINVEWCRELWIINLSANRVRSVQGLCRFPVLGSLSLCNNRLDWQELRRLSHIHLLSLSLTGNYQLDTDPYYRYHVIDILPHLWMLDGQLITAGERKRVQQFFSSSAASAHPVRRKGSSQCVFVPTSLQNLLVTGVYGKRTTQLMTRFPLKYTHNIELDKKRLVYLASLMEEDLKIESEHRRERGEESFTVPPLQRLLEERSVEREQCNMLLLLLVTSLEFRLPADLMLATLETAKLSYIRDFACQELFSLPPHVLFQVVSLLLSGAAIDRDEHKEGGLYPQLYEGIQSLVCSILRKQSMSTSSTHSSAVSSTSICSISSPTKSMASSTNSSSSSSTGGQYQQYRCLIASEVVHLMCLVPLFFDCLETNSGVLEMVSVATNNRSIGDVISHIAWRIQNNGGDVWDLYHEIATYLLHTTTANVFSKRRNKMISRQRTSSLHHQQQQLQHASSQIFQSPKRSLQLPPRSFSAGSPSARRQQHRPAAIQPELGDLVLCAPERLARIVALPEPHVAVLQLTSLTAKGPLGPPDSYFYTDPRGLTWDGIQGHWTRDDLSSELSAGRLNPNTDPSQGHIYSPSPDSLSIGFTRPSSQMSYISEDLQTIPSVEELTLVNDVNMIKEEEQDEREESDGVLMRVDINSRGSPIRTLSQRPKTPEQIEEAQFIHQQHILEQYTLNKTAAITGTPARGQEMESDTVTGSDQQQLSTGQDKSDLSNLIVPTPKLTFPPTWNSAKSLPQSLMSSAATAKSHSCQSPKQSRADTQTGSASTVSSRSNLFPFQEGHQGPIVVNAWSAVRSGAQPKQTRVSKVRAAASSDRLYSGVPAPHLTPPPSRPASRQSCSSVVLQLHPSPLPVSNSSSSSSFQRSSVYATRQKTKSHHFQNTKPSSNKRGGPNVTRKLGDVRLSLVGTSAW